MTSPRELINKAAGLAFGEERAALLERALDDADPEAHAIAVAMLAQQFPDRLGQAVSAGAAAIESGAAPDWIRAHLAEAAILAGDDEAALRFAGEVDPGFFPANDLAWRVVRLSEIKAIALLRLGRADALDVVDDLLADIVRGDDDDDLPPPSHLVRVALTLGARPVLDRVAQSLELDDWFPPSVVAEIRAALGS
ncbi:hypothetical protein [Amycolatopsis sp. NPDC059657]|uniref:hypothetical protein n=1 Tax=Amycolatopsis sp. NPDC059657 TaxID=3346899 RepID=UPI0036731042